MIITIHSIPQELIMQTVFLEPTRDNESFLFRCYHCGTVIARIKGKVSGIMSGFIPLTDVPVISQCPQCKENYTFFPITNPYIKPEIPVRLRISTENNNWSNFLCVKCRTPLIRYQLDSAYLIPSLNKIKIPEIIKCPDCDMLYSLDEIVSKNDII